MDAEILCPFGLELLEALHHLFFGHAIFGIAGLVHHLEALFALPQAEGSAGVVAAEHRLGHPGHPLQKAHHGGVIQIDIGAQLIGLLHVLAGGLVGGEHNLTARKAHRLAEHQLGQGRTVHAAALFPQNLQDIGIGQGLDGKVFLKSRMPFSS